MSLLILLLLTLMSLACGSDGYLGNDERAVPLAVRHGSEITTAATMSRIVWAAPNQIAFVSADYRFGYIRDLNNGTQRPVAIAGPGGQVHYATIGSSGAVYTVETTVGKGLSRQQGTINELITTRPTGMLALEHFEPALDLPNGDVAYVVRPDSLYVRAADGTNRFVNSGCAALAAVSPTGTSVACFTVASQVLLRTFALANGSITNVDTGNHFPIQVIWKADGMYLLGRSGPYVLRTPTGSTVVADYASSLEYAVPGAALSPDLTRFAYWTHYCASGLQLVCSRSQYSLNVMNVSTRAVTRVAVHDFVTGRNGSGAIAFSPDGREVAYVFADRLFRISVN